MLSVHLMMLSEAVSRHPQACRAQRLAGSCCTKYCSSEESFFTHDTFWRLKQEIWERSRREEAHAVSSSKAQDSYFVPMTFLAARAGDSGAVTAGGGCGAEQGAGKVGGGGVAAADQSVQRTRRRLLPAGRAEGPAGRLRPVSVQSQCAQRRDAGEFPQLFATARSAPAFLCFSSGQGLVGTWCFSLLDLG